MEVILANVLAVALLALVITLAISISCVVVTLMSKYDEEESDDATNGDNFNKKK